MAMSLGKSLDKIGESSKSSKLLVDANKLYSWSLLIAERLVALATVDHQYDLAISLLKACAINR